MKKTVFTFSAIAIVCGTIFFACSKDDNSATHVGYASQNGTGTNPDPNHTNTTSGVTTAGTTTSGSTTGSTTSTNTTTTAATVTLTTSSGPATGTITSSTCGTNTMNGTCNNTLISNISLSFSGAPSLGSYNVVPNAPTAGQVLVSYNGNYASAGSVLITVSNGKNVATFVNITGTTPASYTLTGGFGCP